MRSARDHDTVSVAIGYAAAVGLAGSVSTLAGIGHPYWAMATAVILFVVPADALIVFEILVIALQFPTELFMTRNYALALVFFTPLILIMTQLAGATEPRTLLVDRAIETIVGAAIGIGVVLAIRPWASQRT